MIIEIIKLINEFIVSISHFAWPIIALAVIFIFQKNIGSLIDRIIELNIPGINIGVKDKQSTTMGSDPTGLNVSESLKKTVSSPTNLSTKTEDSQASEEKSKNESKENNTNLKLKEIDDSLNTATSKSVLYYEEVIRDDLKELKSDEPKQIDILVKALAITEGKLYYQNLHNAIWGSQVALLHHLNSNLQGSSLEVLKVFYDRGAKKTPAMYTDYKFEQYLEYLIVHKLIKKEDSHCLITQLGIDYLGYLVLYGIKEPISY